MLYYYMSRIAPFILVYGMAALLILVIWHRSKKESEDHLPLKTVGYLLLSAFFLSINQFHLPIGAVIAFMVLRRTTKNRTYKLNIIILGILIYLSSFYPLGAAVDDIFYPKDRMETYLQENMDYAHKGFSMTFMRANGTIYYSLFEKDERGRQFYEAMLDAKPLHTRMSVDNERETIIRLNQDRDEHMERFRRLIFYISNDGHVITLQYGERSYKFMASTEFRDLYENIREGRIGANL
jgi:hypothetical protein